MNKILILISVIGISGCASAGMNSSCGHIMGNEVTIPYVGGKANGSVFACHMGCFGNCPKPDYSALSTLTSEYIKAQNNAITVSVPMTATLTPTK